MCVRCHGGVSGVWGGWGGEYVCLRVHVTCRGRASYLVNRLLEVKILLYERGHIRYPRFQVQRVQTVGLTA